MEPSPVTDEMADSAIAWFARLRADNVSSDDRSRFLEWLRSHRLHQHAFIEIVNLWEDLSVVKVLEWDELRPYPQLWELKQEYQSVGS